ncbi:CCA tRNA nucleotidyltransferase [Bacillus sp. ISL-47]|uniref:CCA tRNA nucleotidyltransferase n=1 Tax=Bacillus sp. ISL-47 TaxID=2819130 RepID=UPI001BECDB88|nr:CCA tRNA nucleotidyltransferase [Bacillus sp. ISL-47]MBT2690037.1 CCA tRNA nucleotidyltransferase [Bacillus sp. ISL-47]MBT2707831.1 CCA tRNA nucleotidyltransferase [Pseudomonas sp. ISL-84]
MKEAFLQAIPVLNKIESAGYEAYFVGGSVRDFLLDKEIADVDIATSATPEEMKSIFSKTLDVGIEHGTVVVLFNGIPYEVTTFRTEAEYLDFRRPSEVQFIRSLEEDLKRRDFTMNAIAMDRNGQLIDPFAGKKAIEDRVIRTVGNPEERFTEDALRMMRAVRFFSQLSFDIEKSTYEALSSLAHLLQKIAVERKLAEFEKLLAGKNRMKALKIIGETGLYRYLPQMSAFQRQLFSSADYHADMLTVEEMWGFLVCLFGINHSAAESFLKGWKLPVKKIRKIRSILKWIRFRSGNEWDGYSLYQAGKESFLSAERIRNVLQQTDLKRNTESLIELYNSLPIKQSSELQLTGYDLMDWFGKPPGAWIRAELEKAETAVLKGELKNSNESIREWLMKCNQNLGKN